MELKVWRRGQPDPRPDGLRQLDAYLDRLGLGHGTLVIFDRRQSEPSEPSLPEQVGSAPPIRPPVARSLRSLPSELAQFLCCMSMQPIT